MEHGEQKMNLFVLLFYIWNGMCGYIIIYLKQVLFQGKDVFQSPLKHFKNLRFTFSVLAVLGVAQGTWLLDAFIRQEMKLSETYGYISLVSAPISVIVMLFTLWLSQKNLSDNVVWWAAGLMALGTLFTMIGGAYLLGGHK